ncbi:SRPBCC domain-containing protein [Thalassococcus sp. CAU 1522]|uniref:SRPBCC domain-containing protein n=1 Tax=Thalassococcus arenae TaxID=2851652 RepID=A0ABS6N470_9RHOB|nr:SRPBCC domain-containing protein [Thalassococcus arenae]MBV2358818.1 SRPBCC domain-containing protein [Thalassococcus arenae]
MNKMTMTKVGETDLRVIRRFDAPPEAVYDAHVDEAKIKRWMLGPEGWSMPDCVIDARPGGAFSYTWENQGGERFTIRGTFVSFDPPHRIVHEETMEMGDDTPPMSRVTTEFAADGDGTLMTMVISYASAEAREGAVASGMEEGMAFSYDNLDRMVTV